MKKHVFGLLTVAALLTGCSNGYLSFAGNSENWEGNYKSNVTEKSEDGEYVFHYKKDDEDATLKNVNVTIGDSIVQREKTHQGNTIRISKQCVDCSVTNESEPIPVTIQWDGKKETFEMTPQ